MHFRRKNASRQVTHCVSLRFRSVPRSFLASFSVLQSGVGFGRLGDVYRRICSCPTDPNEDLPKPKGAGSTAKGGANVKNAKIDPQKIEARCEQVRARILAHAAFRRQRLRAGHVAHVSRAPPRPLFPRGLPAAQRAAPPRRCRGAPTHFESRNRHPVFQWKFRNLGTCGSGPRSRRSRRWLPSTNQALPPVALLGSGGQVHIVDEAGTVW